MLIFPLLLWYYSTNNKCDKTPPYTLNIDEDVDEEEKRHGLLISNLSMRVLFMAYNTHEEKTFIPIDNNLKKHEWIENKNNKISRKKNASADWTKLFVAVSSSPQKLVFIKIKIKKFIKMTI